MSKPIFLISEEQLKDIRGMIFHEDEIKFEKLSWKIISHNLSTALEESYKNGFNDGQAEGLPSALKAEREKMLDSLSNWTPGYKHNKGKWFVYVDDLMDKIQSLRSEP